MRDAKLAGRVVIRWVIDTLGKVSVATVASSELADDGVGQCMADAVEGWTFPKTEGGGTVVVNYPFLLSVE